jgi:hypothetical protein
MTRPKSASATPGLAFKVQKIRKVALKAAKDAAAQFKASEEAEIAVSFTSSTWTSTEAFVLQATREKREAKKRRRAENEAKASTYQVISDPKKLKSMSKKQLRSVKRTRLNEDGVQELVPAYS